MVEEQKVRIDQSMSKIIDDVDKSHLRQLQVIKPLIIFFFFLQKVLKIPKCEN